jgi:hypothetical protein
MPDTPALRAAVGQSGQQAEGCGLPTAHVLVQCHADTGYRSNARPAPLRTHELADLAWTPRATTNSWRTSRRPRVWPGGTAKRTKRCRRRGLSVRCAWRSGRRVAGCVP